MLRPSTAGIYVHVIIKMILTLLSGTTVVSLVFAKRRHGDADLWHRSDGANHGDGQFDSHLHPAAGLQVSAVIAKNDEERVYAAHPIGVPILTSRVHAESG